MKITDNKKGRINYTIEATPSELINAWDNNILFNPDILKLAEKRKEKSDESVIIFDDILTDDECRILGLVPSHTKNTMKKITITFNSLETDVNYYIDTELSHDMIIDSISILGADFSLDDLSIRAIDKIRDLVIEQTTLIC